MKKRWLSLIVLAICFCLIVPMIVSCGCTTGSTDTSSGNDDEATEARITLKLNGGEIEDWDKKFDWTIGDEIDLSDSIPTKAGTTFLYWAVDGEEVEFPYVVEGDVTFEIGRASCRERVCCAV